MIKYPCLIETAQIIILVLDNEGHIVYFNSFMEEISGYYLEEVKGKEWCSTFLPKCDRNHIRSLFNKAISGMQTRGNINQIITKNEHKREIEWNNKTLMDNEGAIIGLIAVGHDITVRKLAEQRLEKYKQMLEASRKESKSFAHRILHIREEEKRVLSANLHNELGECAIALSSSLAEIEDDIKNENLKKALETVRKIKKIQQNYVLRLKKIAIDLRPPGLEVMGIIDVLKEHIADTEKTSNLSIDFQTNIVKKKISDKISIALYRIIQESLNNIIKHAKAERVKVSLYSRNNELDVNIQDDGVGFDSDKKLKESGIHCGIIGMKEMTESLEGTFVIESKPGKGNTISLLFPNIQLR